jgi:PKD repeat protein
MPDGMRRLLLAMLPIAACADNVPAVIDAGRDLPAPDGLPSPGDAPISLAVDFTVQNCPAFDPVAMTCTGVAPLTLRFVPLATTTVTQYIWNFGESSDNVFDPGPTYTYAFPGTFTVKLTATGVGGGFVAKEHTGFIVALTNALGQPCDSDRQCDPGLYCLCPGGSGCSAGPARGMCAATCPAGLCEDGQVCAGLLTTSTPPPSGVEAWQTDLCLAGCAQDTDCAGGLHCRTLPPGPAGSAWVHGCFSSVPRNVGDPCTDPAGNRRDDLCASGLCADLGALGLCSMDCKNATCPPGSDCAVLGDGRRLCLRPCVGADACTADELLTCVQPGLGALGYELVEPEAANAASTYCAPKPCRTDADCLPNGSCYAPSGPGRCARR